MTLSPQIEGSYTTEQVIPLRHYGRWISAVLLLLALAAGIWSVVHNSGFGWSVVGSYLTTSSVLSGLGVTMELTVVAMAIGIVGGIVLAVMRLSPNPIVGGSAWSFVWFFRGTPVLLQILFWYYIAALYPTLSIGIPFGPTFFHANANTLITKFVAGSLALGLNEAAYMSEIVRAGILSVDSGQHEAAHALGLTRAKTMRRIVLPQAMRIIIPPTGNEIISMLKTTALVSVIALSELLGAVQQIYARNYQTIPLLIVAAIWYLTVTSVLYVVQFFIERHFSRGQRATARGLGHFFQSFAIRPRGSTRTRAL